MFKFLHAADIHLDSPLQGLERYEGAPVERIRGATRKAFDRLVQLALDERVAFVLIAGDLYDGAWKDYNTGLYLVRQMARLRAAEIPVFAIAGNHDAANKMTRGLRLPDNVVMLSTEAPETRVLEDVGVAVHGQGFATEAVADNLAERYPAGRRGYFNIGLMHTCVTGREGHGRYAPCALNDLLVKHYDYWALGHIHQREELDSETPVVFPGNVQGRHVRETGAKGCMIVTVADGRRARLEFHPLDVLRWERCAVDAAGAEGVDTVLDRFADQLRQLRDAAEGRLLAVRVEVVGPCAAHEKLRADPHRFVQEIRAAAAEAGGEEVWVEKVKVRTTPPSQGVDLQADGPIGELAAVIEELGADVDCLQRLRDELADVKRKLPAELAEGPEALRLDDPAWLRAVLDGVRPLLVSRLLSRGDVS